MRNAELAQEFYAGWQCWFHCARDVPGAILAELRRHPHVRVIQMPEDGGHRGLFWRFFPASDPDVEVMIVRDCDSRLGHREAMAVREWLMSDRMFHVMRDHPSHNVAVLGGMFGVKRPLLGGMREWIGDAPEYARAGMGSDQDFLTRVVWPRVRETTLIHDDRVEPGPWPVPRAGLRFVGQAFDANDNPLYPEHGMMGLAVPEPLWRVDLRDVPVFVVSGRDQVQRVAELTRWLRHAGFRNPVVFRDEFGGKNRSNCQNHLSAVTACSPPFLVLEDDARPLEGFRPRVDVPLGAAALYLGTSRWGLTTAGARDGGVLALGARAMPRVLNMLSLHAVLYLDGVYAHSVAALLTEGLRHQSPPPSDVLVAGQMPTWNVCAVNPPVFYQADGRNDDCTRSPLDVLGDETLASPEVPSIPPCDQNGKSKTC